MSFFKRIDYTLLVPAVGLTGVSLSIIYSTSPQLFTQQLIFIIIGFVLFFTFSSIDFRIWPKFFWFFYSLAIVLLLVSFLGREVRGSSRWIDLGWFRLQPSELIKPFFTVIMAELFSKSYGKGWRKIIKPFLFLAPVVFLIFKQPDLGNVIVYFFIFVVCIILSEIPLRSLLFGTGSLILFFPIAWNFMKQYQKSRIFSFLDPTSDPAGAGYNALQAIIAIGSGRLFGFGFGRGTQSHLLFLPEYHTDFVFASIGEELGFLGAFLVICFYFVLLGRILLIASKLDNKFARLLAIGIFAQIFIQVFINIGMNLGILPITGITLPLLSYGGSSIISTFIGLGIVSNIGKSVKNNAPIEIK